ncbi:MAG: NADH-quinone oxidoreductase subunit M [Methylococcaceae bacterium]|nr:NADH-quinone oxidoreductase subunit M [Methylococcaceae bacterium]
MLLSHFPWLSAIVALPLLSMGAAWLARSPRQAFAVGISGASIQLILVIRLLWNFRLDTAEFQWVEQIPVTPFLSYHLGVDGVGILFLGLTSLLTLLVILYGEIVHERPAGVYVASVFAFEAVLSGLFLSIDLLEFWIVCALELIPGGFILHRWGTAQGRTLALRRYLQDMSGGLLLTLAAILIVGWHHASVTGDWSFALADLLATPLSSKRQSMVFVLIFYGLAVRMAFFPFHAWLPNVAQHGPLATLCVYLVGVKAGIYALLRFALPLLPAAAHEWKRFIVAIAVVGMFYGALLALMQINLRRLLAFAAVSHSAMLVIGVFCLNLDGMRGSLLLAINFGVAAAALLFVTGVLYRCTGTSQLPRLGGMFDALPLLGLTFFLAALTTMAMPGTPGFDAAHLILESAIETHHWGLAVAIAIGNVASAAFLLWAFQRAFLARRRDRNIHPESIRLSLTELTLTGTLCALMLGVGFYSKPWLEIVDATLSELARQISQPLAHG